MTLLSVRGRRWLAWVVGVGVSLCVGGARGQSAAALPTSAQGVLLEMAGHAAVIFTGEVVGVDREDTSGYVDVKFRVDQAVKGVSRNMSRNGAYVMREWAGLWVGGAERYRVGQRFLMLLTARGSSGMSAPVGGQDGAIPLTAGVDQPLFHGNGDAPVDKATTATEAQVDLRWLAARAARTTVASGSAMKTGSVKPRVTVAGESVGAGVGMASAASGKTVAAPVTDPVSPVDGGEGAPGDGWAGPVAPLANAGLAAVQAGTYPAATKLSSILALLMTGSGSGHVAR